MKHILKLLSLISATSFALVSGIDSRDIQNLPNMAKSGTPSYILNPVCEKNTANITDADSIVTRVSSGGLGDLGTDCQIDADASGEKAIFLTRAYPKRLEGGGCEIIGVYKGDASQYKVTAIQDGNVLSTLTLNNATGVSQPYVLDGFACGADNTDLITVEIEALDNAAALFNHVFLHGGEQTGIGLSEISAWEDCTVTGTWTSNTTYECKRRAIGDSYEFDIAVLSTGAPNAATLSLTFPSDTVIDTSKLALGGENVPNLGVASFYDESGSTGTQILLGMVRPLSTTTFRPEVMDNQGANDNWTSALTQTYPVTIASGDRVTMRFTVPVAGLAGNVVQRADTLDLSGFAKIAGAASCSQIITAGTMTSFAEDTDCSTPTVSGNAAAAGTKIFGFVAPTLLPGKYAIVASGGILVTQSTSGQQNCNYELYDGTNSGGIISAREGQSVGLATPSTIWGQFEYDSLQTNKQFEIRAARLSGNGKCQMTVDGADLTFTLIPLTQAVPSPFVAGSTFFGRSGMVKGGAAVLACSSGSTITSNPDSMVASIGNASSGVCTVTLTTGYFSSTPICIGNSNELAASALFITTNATSATSLTWAGYDDSGTGSTSPAGNLICFGD